MATVGPARSLDGSVALHRQWACGGLAVLGIVAAVLAVVSGVGGVDGGVGFGGAVRAVSTVAFMLLGPGWAVVGFLDVGTPSLHWAVSVAVGAAVGALGAEAMLLTGRWYPAAGLVVLAVLTVPVLVRHAARAPVPRR